MCRICRNEIDYNQKTPELDCSGCPNLTKIPNIPGLRSIWCVRCPKLTEIVAPAGLYYLNCIECKSLTQIPQISGYLFCISCPKLTKISITGGISIIHCDGCISLTHILYDDFSCNSFRNFSCNRCRNLIQTPSGIDNLFGNYGCPWLNHRSNQGYEENIKKLVILQRWMKRLIVRKRLVRMIPRLMPLYYHPLAKGGYFHKKHMLEFVDSMKKNEKSIVCFTQ